MNNGKDNSPLDDYELDSEFDSTTPANSKPSDVMRPRTGAGERPSPVSHAVPKQIPHQQMNPGAHASDGATRQIPHQQMNTGTHSPDGATRQMPRQQMNPGAHASDGATRQIPHQQMNPGAHASDGATRQMPRQQMNPGAHAPDGTTRQMPRQQMNPGTHAPDSTTRQMPAQPALSKTGTAGKSGTSSHKDTPTASSTSVRRAATSSVSITGTAKVGKTKKSKSDGGKLVMSLVKGSVYLVVVLLIAIVLSVFIIKVGNDVFAFVKSDEQVEVTIPEDATLDDVTKIFHENSLIEYPKMFKLYAKLKKDSGEYEAGVYTLSPSMNYDQLRRGIKKKAATGTSWVTIPEGYTVDEIIDLFLSYGIGTREGFVDAINNYDFDYWFIDELESNGWSADRYYRLEGYLYPDTYEFYNDSNEVAVINKLLKCFNDRFDDKFRARATELGMMVDQVVTLASMIEKEGNKASDVRAISGVFHNRLKNPAKYATLNSDATIVYAIQHDTGEHITNLGSAESGYDTNYESPYNTYHNNGLPPGAIGNPGLSAIRFALYPADNNYYYFVASVTGEVYYASTPTAHEANIAQARQDAENVSKVS